MNMQQSPRKTAADLEQQVEQINRAITANPQELSPPVYGEEYRKAIDSLVEGIVSDLCKQMEELHLTLKGIEQEVLKSAERARSALRDHAGVCVKVRDEIKTMKIVITDLAEQAREPRP
jgi:hypothetical protein